MRRSAALSLSICLALAAGCTPSSSDGTVAERGKTAPRLTGKSIEGEYLALQDFRGQVVLLNVWATWCAPCRHELPELARLHKDHGAEGFTVLGVSVDAKRDFQKVRQAATHHGLDYPILFDPNGVVISPFGVRGYPTTFLIGRDGTIRWRRDGIIKPDDPELKKELALALAEPKPK